MAEVDWATLTGTALGTGDVARGVSSAFTLAHTDAGSYCYGLHSLTSTVGFAGKSLDISDFNPVTGTRKGASIRCLMKRYASGGNYAPMFGLIQGTDPTTANGYLIGLSAASSYKVAVKKGVPVGGLDHTGSYILRSSDDAFTAVGDAASVWFHLRLDVLVNPHGEVIINVYENDVQTNGLGSGKESWVAIDGITQFIDDPAGVFSGSVPYLDGFYAIFGMYTSAAGSIALFDHIEVLRQTAP
jgi:hypothetical protein